MARVLNTSSHPIDLSDGRTVGVLEEAADVDTDHAHQRDLVLSGHLLVLEGMTPRKRATADDADPNQKEKP